MRSRLAEVAPHAIEDVRSAALALDGSPGDYDALLERVGSARFVFLGEATHGTHEFYRERTRITERLVEEKGFRAVAIEGDWPDAFRVNRFVRGASEDGSAVEALDDFRRFPSWMWRNTDAVELVSWLRAHNAGVPETKRAGFYGLDLYSLHASMEGVLRYLDQVDPQAASRARDRYACFERFGADPQTYGYATTFGVEPSCEREVLRQVREMRERSAELVARDGRFSPDDHFHAAQSALVVRNAEAYYRDMFVGRVRSWNRRDAHMLETLASLADHLATTGPSPVRMVVWAHNSHLGDARATELGDAGEWNLGQLARERFGDDPVLVGFTTHSGFVTAADDWGDPPRQRRVRPAIEGSYESLFHAVGRPRWLLFPRPDTDPPRPLGPLLERAIGVVYKPETERESHYFEARAARQFDAIVHVDETSAVEPLDRVPSWTTAELPETYPTGV